MALVADIPSNLVVDLRCSIINLPACCQIIHVVSGRKRYPSSLLATPSSVASGKQIFASKLNSSMQIEFGSSPIFRMSR